MLTAAKQLEGVPKPTYKRGRRCNTCGCILSIYNRYSKCWAHRPERTELAPLRMQHERENFLDAITELIEDPYS